jgi:cytochrome c oxidase subunit IV
MSTHHQEWKRLGDGTLPCEDQDSGLGHVVPFKVYFNVYILLLVGTALTLWAATQDFGIFNLEIAIAIATIKSCAVTLFFMHVWWEKKAIWTLAIYPIFILLLMILGTLGDKAADINVTPMNPAPPLVGMSK